MRIDHQLLNVLGSLALLAAPLLAMAADQTPAPTGSPLPSNAAPATSVAPPPTTVRVPGNPDGSCPTSDPIKVSKSGIYHLTSDPNYAATKAKTCFATPQAAEQAGYRAPRKP